MHNPKYRIYEGPNKVIAVSSFAGRDVRAVAKCHPGDEYDFDKGVALATARCNHKIAMLRLKRAYQRRDDLLDELTVLFKKLGEARDYERDAEAKLNEAELELESTLSFICHPDKG